MADANNTLEDEATDLLSGVWRSFLVLDSFVLAGDMTQSSGHLKTPRRSPGMRSSCRTAVCMLVELLLWCQPGKQRVCRKDSAKT